MLLGGAVVALMAVIGVGLTTWIDVPLRFEERLFVGLVVGVVAVIVTAFVVFEIAGMGAVTLALALGVPGIPAGIGLGRHRPSLAVEAAAAGRRLRRPSRHASSLRPFAVLTVASAAVATRVLALAYQRRPDGLAAGSLATWADWAAHLAYAGSFAYGDNRGLDLPLAAGTPLRYHFFANFTGAVFTTTGLGLERALVISAWIMAIALPPLLFCGALRLAGSRLAAGLTVVLFTLTGGLGAWYFLVDVGAGGWDIVTALPQTYARMPDQHLWVDNTISASLYAQRSTLYGSAFGAAALILLLAGRPTWRRSGFLAAGVLVGITGITHVHLLATALALGLLAAIADRRRAWWWFLVPAAVIGLPLAVAISPPDSAMRWLVGWMAPGADQNWLWFWLRNVGLLLPLFLLISILGGVPDRIRRLTMPLWLWFIVPNVVAFHPSEWNNTKFFLFWQLAGCLAVGAWVRRLVGPRPALRRGAGPAVRLAAAALVVAALTVTGGLDTVRAMQRSSAIPWAAADDVAAAHWLRDAATPGDRLVYGATNTSAVAAMSGVPALSGYPGWTNDLGLPDWYDRVEASRRILAGEPDADALIDRYGIDYVVIGPRERAEMGASDAFWDRHGDLAFAQGDYRIYRVAG